MNCLSLECPSSLSRLQNIKVTEALWTFVSFLSVLSICYCAIPVSVVPILLDYLVSDIIFYKYWSSLNVLISKLLKLKIILFMPETNMVPNFVLYC